MWLEVPPPIWQRLKRKKPLGLMPVAFEIGSASLHASIKPGGHQARFFIPQVGLQPEYDARTPLRPVASFAGGQTTRGNWAKRATKTRPLEVRNAPLK